MGSEIYNSINFTILVIKGAVHAIKTKNEVGINFTILVIKF